MKESGGCGGRAATINGGHNNAGIEIIPVMLALHISDSLTFPLGEKKSFRRRQSCPAQYSESTSV